MPNTAAAKTKIGIFVRAFDSMFANVASETEATASSTRKMALNPDNKLELARLEAV